MASPWTIPRVLVAVLAAASLVAGGCALPVMAWPEWPAGFDQSVRIEEPDGTPADAGYVLLRVFAYDSSGTAEGDRSVRNQQVLDAAFGYRRAVEVNTKSDVTLRHRLVDVVVLPIRAGAVELPTVTRAGSLWVVVEKPKARSGIHPRTHFAEIQAFVSGWPPSTRAEVTADLYLIRVQDELPPIEWRQRLDYARRDVARFHDTRYVVLEFLDAETARLRRLRPEAFVPDGVGVPKTGPGREKP